ncbi:McrC family protein [Serratia fonticola]|uniref:McrC family protein n=1 Tax=Serratia fonticola TaxID=47917 RepID=UPI0021ADFD18|nr:McrC family protein [Serratia fonticola]
MSSIITVREYARLTTSELREQRLDYAQIPATLFDWLCRLSAGYRTQHAPILAEITDRRTLFLDNYVGVLQAPCGTVLEVLPKIHELETDISASRQLLKDMIVTSLDVPVRETGIAYLEPFPLPLNEWVASQFLTALNTLMKRGVRSDYLRSEHYEPFLRGQLDVARQMRQPAGEKHLFHLRYDIFSPDRAENRLIVSALQQVIRYTKHPELWRLARELHLTLNEIPSSKNIDSDFGLWHDDRLMKHYQPVKPWCELILAGQMPLAIKGKTKGISMLFPMEKLFERYVEISLRLQLAPGTQFTSQARRYSLCTHKSENLFQLRPDILLKNGEKLWVLDAKWKRLYEHDSQSKYSLSQADFYQMYAYGQKYMLGEGDMALIYPSCDGFKTPLPVFNFDEKLRLWVLPFAVAGINKGKVIHDGNTSLPFDT